jgi:hypothetical protein
VLLDFSCCRGETFATKQPIPLENQKIANKNHRPVHAVLVGDFVF